MNQRYQMVTTNATELRKLVGVLAALGFEFYGSKDPEQIFNGIDGKSGLKDYPCPVLYLNSKTLGGNPAPNPDIPTISLDELVDLLTKVVDTKTVKLNDEYQAVVGAKGVHVAPYHVPFSKIYEIGKVVEVARNFYQVVSLNDSYDVEVTREGITVGCQKFSFEAFDALLAAVHENDELTKKQNPVS